MTGDRVLSTFGMIALQIVALGIVFFWAMGAILLATGNGGQINDINLTSFWRTIFWAYPILVIFISPIAWLSFFRKADLLAQAMLTLPIGLLGLLYFVYVLSNKPF